MAGEVLTIDSAIEIAQNAIWLAFKLSMPFLLGSLIIGLVVSIIQAAMQLQEPTITFVPKLITLGVLAIILFPWLMNVMTDYVVDLFINLKNFW